MAVCSLANLIAIILLLDLGFALASNDTFGVFYRILDKRLTKSYSQISVNSSSQCCAECKSDRRCLAVSVRISDGTCLMSDFKAQDFYFEDKIMQFTNWMIYTTDGCDVGWTLYNYISCYYHVTEAASWSTSQDKCIRFGASMAKIDGLEKHGFIQDAFGNDISYWLGLTDLQHEGKYVWASDGSVPVFSLWVGGEPNGGRRENCAIYVQGWKDYPCGVESGTICEKRLL